MPLSQALEASDESRPIKILVSIQPYALILSELNVQGLEVSVLQEAAMNPHAFQMKPSHLKKIAEADLVIWGGKQLEPYLSKAFANKQQLVLADIPEVKLLKENHEDHDDEQAMDPHIWLSEKNSQAIIQAMAMVLGVEVPKTAAPRTNEPLATAKKENLKTLVLVNHNAYSYLESELGLEHDFVIYNNHNAKPGLKHWHELNQLLETAKQKEQAVCLISSPAFSESTEAKKLKQKIKETGLKDFRLAIIDPMASSKTYKDFSAYLNESRQALLQCVKN